MDLLRFTTAGSVDDGKSTLIGRLLYDSKSIFEDQLDAVQRASTSTGEEGVNLALLTDGLRDEREQKITIDVAYRYFATPKRKFIIADTPGHEQYTRNMVTGASTADLAIILIDATKGVLTQSKRHAFISSLLRIPHLVLAVNKMDLVGYDQAVFDDIVAAFGDYTLRLDVQSVTAIPISALDGDNIVNASTNMDWYDGASLLHHLETVNVEASVNHVDFRFPVQTVIRPNQTFRGYAGQVASGRVKVGDEVMVLPSKRVSKVKALHRYKETLQAVSAEDTLIMELADEIDVSRGDMIVRAKNIPTVRDQVECFLTWMDEEPMQRGKSYQLMHTTHLTSCYVESVEYLINVDTQAREPATTLSLNDIARVRIQTARPFYVDPYKVNKRTGAFILIDPHTKNTVAAGMIRAGSTTAKGTQTHSPHVSMEPWNVPRETREQRHGHPAQVLWMTGISGSGKSTIGRELEHALWEKGYQTMLLDGDTLRSGLNGDLGFSMLDREENIRRVGHVAKLFYEHGNLVICTFISPTREVRESVRALFGGQGFQEVYVKCSSEAAAQRDPKGLYAKAKAGEITGLTGYDGLYEEPEQPEWVIDTETQSVDEAVAQLVEGIGRLGRADESS